MAEIDDVLKVLKDWKEQPKPTVTKVLTYVHDKKHIKGNDVDTILKGISEFHREIGKAAEDIVDLKWYELCINSKKKLKKLQEAGEKQKKNLELKQKLSVPLVVEYPPQLTAGRGPHDERCLKFMFKSFVTNFEQAMKDPKAWQFILATYKQIKYKFDDRVDGFLNKRVQSICNRLAKESSTECKGKMLKGEISPKELSNDDEEMYFDQKMKDHIRRMQLEVIQSSRTDFYDQMKKNIYKNASELCIFCEKRRAYCESMLQLRASDEPETRFMRCNSCNKTWRD